MSHVQLLPEELINKIAAGEVVERPASVVKELVENSIDAGARHIEVQLSAGGLDLIQVTDDGCGMSKEDAAMSLVRHATSKIHTLDDLFHIETKGFRGEAVPAIASVSRFELQTSEAGASEGTLISGEGGVDLKVEVSAPIGGTRIAVRDLFFNTPARRKYMRKANTELSHCQEAVVRLILAHPEVSFELQHEGVVVLSVQASGNDDKQRIASALGTEVEPHLVAVDEKRLGLTLSGFVASPEFTMNSARGIYALVNRRYIRDRSINFAVARAFQDALPPGRQPVVVLFLDVDPSAVDVNVHPQKLEVRFSDTKAIQEILFAGISSALKAAHWSDKASTVTSPENQVIYEAAVAKFLDRAQAQPSVFERGAGGELHSATASTSAAMGFGQLRPDVNEAPPAEFFSQVQVMGVLGKKFWVAEGRGYSLLVLDPVAALQRLIFSQLTGKHQPTTQQTFLTQTVHLNRQQTADLERWFEVFEKLGVQIETFGSEGVVVRAAPFYVEGMLWAEALFAVTALAKGEESLFQVAAVISEYAAQAQWGQFGGSAKEWQNVLGRLDEVDFYASRMCKKVVLWTVPFLEIQMKAR